MVSVIIRVAFTVDVQQPVRPSADPCQGSPRRRARSYAYAEASLIDQRSSGQAIKCNIQVSSASYFLNWSLIVSNSLLTHGCFDVQAQGAVLTLFGVRELQIILLVSVQSAHSSRSSTHVGPRVKDGLLATRGHRDTRTAPAWPPASSLTGPPLRSGEAFALMDAGLSGACTTDVGSIILDSSEAAERGRLTTGSWD